MIIAISLIAGYVASLLLAISLIVNNDLKFRWLNTLGCVAFIVYGILIHAFPVILTNSILLVINLYYLIKIYRTDENFDLLEINKQDKIVQKFLSFYRSDIDAYFPEYNIQSKGEEIMFVVLRDLVIANIFSATISDDGNALVNINYTVPKYRDYKVGKFIFETENKFLISKGVKCIVYTKVFNKNHEQFLKVMGFKKASKEGIDYIKYLDKP